MIIVHIVEPFASGVALFVKSLTESMPDDTHIIVHGERKEEMLAKEVKRKFPQKNIRFIKWQSAQRAIDPIKDFLAFVELRKILKRLKAKNLVDAVHLHSSKSGLLGRAACRLVGIDNVFYTPNGASFLSAKNKLTAFFYRQVEKVGNRLGGKVICSSSSELEQYLTLGIDAAYINNGTDVEKVFSLHDNKKYKKFRIVTSGRIEHQKNPALFNEIASYFVDMPDIEFVWIGEGTERNLLTAPNIKISGWLPTHRVHEIIARSHVYLSSSRYEGLSFAVLEAMALKKPMLLSNCTGNADIVKQGINGDLFTTSYDAIVKILQYHNNKEMLEVMGEYSREICEEEFNTKNNYSSYRKFYEQESNTIPANQPKWGFN